jgi:hypothetical protein
MTLAAKIGDTLWLLAQQIGQETPKAFVALLVFWLALLFASFGLFAPPNLTSAVTLTLCALAVAAAVAMFLEREQGGLVRISSEAMRQAVETLEAEPSNQNAPSATSCYLAADTLTRGPVSHCGQASASGRIDSYLMDHRQDDCTIVGSPF